MTTQVATGAAAIKTYADSYRIVLSDQNRTDLSQAVITAVAGSRSGDPAGDGAAAVSQYASTHALAIDDSQARSIAQAVIDAPNQPGGR